MEGKRRSGRAKGRRQRGLNDCKGKERESKGGTKGGGNEGLEGTSLKEVKEHYIELHSNSTQGRPSFYIKSVCSYVRLGGCGSYQ